MSHEIKLSVAAKKKRPIKRCINSAKWNDNWRNHH